MIIVLLLLVYLLLINAATYRAFARDKQAAITHDQRTPEATLLWWAQMGGWVGAKLAQRRLRHKTTKQPFGRHLNQIGQIHAMTLIFVALVFGFLAFTAPSKTAAPNRAPLNAAQDAQPAREPLEISRRPPAGRPAAL